MQSLKKCTSHTPSLGRILGGKKSLEEEVNQERERHVIQEMGSKKEREREVIIESLRLTSMHETRRAANQPWGKRNASNCATPIAYDMSGKTVWELGKNYS